METVDLGALGSAQASANGEEARGLLQHRVALFWKVLFIVNAVSFALGSLGAIAEPGWDHLLNLLSVFQSGGLWWWCARKQRSITASRWADAGGLWFNVSIGAFLGRYFAGQFALERSVGTEQESMLADAFVSMILLGGTTMMVTIRAALVPSSPRRTFIVTSIAGLPALAAVVLLAPTTGALVLRPNGLGAAVWLPSTLALMWAFVLVTCMVISWVIYSLRAQVRQARRLGQYQLGAKLGEGGMGVVYEATHVMLRRPTAVKLLPPDRAGDKTIARFEREVQQTSRLEHPNNVSIYDYGRTPDGQFYYAMEYLDGMTLEQLVDEAGPLSAARVKHILTQAASALAEAHALGLVHRDIKPANIMLCQRAGVPDTVKVLDYGLVKELDAGTSSGDITHAETLVGTPRYLAPEAITNPEAVGPPSDVYALGAVAFLLLTGREIFTGRTLVEICADHLHTTPPTPSAALGAPVDGGLEDLILGCVSKDPGQRPQDAAAFGAALSRLELEDWTLEDARAFWRGRPQSSTRPPGASAAGDRTQLTVDLRARGLD